MKLKPFQVEGAQFLASRTRALLADEPGVGKTAQLITACYKAKADTVGVICPSIGIEHWRREFLKWEQADRDKLLVDIIPWGDAHRVKPRAPWDVLIPDEVQFGKNPQARRTRAVFGTGGLVWHAKRIWAASGTPAPNHAGELWPILRAFGLTKMDQEQFVQHFCRVHSMTGKVLGNRPERVAELRGILKSFSIRRLKKDVLPELGAIDIQEWYVSPSARFTFDVLPDQDALRAEIAGKSDEDLLTFLAGSEEFSTLRRYNALLKAPAVFETVKFELENGLLDKVVIYGIHIEAMEALQRNFGWAKIPSTLIIGDTPIKQRDAMIEDWKRHGQVLIASSLIANTALDFSCCHQGIMIELDWTPGGNLQAMQRMHRHGQDNPVTVRVAIGTPVDEIVSDVLIRKTKSLAEIFD